ncbi:MAG: hypothetical protein Q7S37_03715 [bacterium]|nr:hypothetical protein [bacterium]
MLRWLKGLFTEPMDYIAVVVIVLIVLVLLKGIGVIYNPNPERLTVGSLCKNPVAQINAYVQVAGTLKLNSRMAGPVEGNNARIGSYYDLRSGDHVVSVFQVGQKELEQDKAVTGYWRKTPSGDYLLEAE